MTIKKIINNCIHNTLNWKSIHTSRNEIKKAGYIKRISLCLLAIFIISVSIVAYAAPSEEQQPMPVASTEVTDSVSTESDATSVKAIAAAITISLGAATGAIAMGVAISKSLESIARQPEAEGKIRTSLILGLVFVETTVIYALVVAIMIIFVL